MVSYSCQQFRVLLLGTAAVALISAQAQTTSASRPRISVETITGSQSLRDGIEIQAGTASLRITALRDDILRVRIAPGGDSPRGRFVGGSSGTAPQVRRCAAEQRCRLGRLPYRVAGRSG